MAQNWAKHAKNLTRTELECVTNLIGIASASVPLTADEHRMLDAFKAEIALRDKERDEVVRNTPDGWNS